MSPPANSGTGKNSGTKTWLKGGFGFTNFKWPKGFLSCQNFGPVTVIQTGYDAYEPTVHTHRWTQKQKNYKTDLG